MSVMAAVGPGAATAASAAYGHGQPLCGGGGGGGGAGGGGARKRKDVGVVQDQESAEPSPAGLRGSSHGGVSAAPRRAAGLFVLETVEEEADAEAERSSIGAASDDEDEDGDEVDSGATSSAAAAGRKGGALASMDMDALDDALPIKRGLSNFFSGKSRSFANLQDAASAVTSARDLAKPENPFNKRRRVLRCCSIRRVASTSLTALPPFFLPPTTADDDDDDGAGAGAGAGGRSG